MGLMILSGVYLLGMVLCVLFVRGAAEVPPCVDLGGN